MAARSASWQPPARSYAILEKLCRCIWLMPGMAARRRRLRQSRRPSRQILPRPIDDTGYLRIASPHCLRRGCGRAIVAAMDICRRQRLYDDTRRAFTIDAEDISSSLRRARPLWRRFRGRYFLSLGHGRGYLCFVGGFKMKFHAGPLYLSRQILSSIKLE